MHIEFLQRCSEPCKKEIWGKCPRHTVFVNQTDELDGIYKDIGSLDMNLVYTKKKSL